MARILRGDIRWAALDPARGQEQAGLRPVLVLSQDVFNISQIRTLAVQRIGNRLARALPEELAKVIEGLKTPKSPSLRWIAQARLGRRVRYGAGLDWTLLTRGKRSGYSMDSTLRSTSRSGQ
jgi:mRNA interferase MazF